MVVRESATNQQGCRKQFPLNNAVYARVYSERQAEKDLSMPAQIKALKEYPLDRQWEVVAAFIGEAESGRST